MKKLIDILQGVNILEQVGDTNILVSSVHFDSRKVNKDDLFVAQKGVSSDGHDYIDAVITQGATVILCEVIPCDCKAGVTYLRVANSAEALGHIASNYYGRPSEQLKLFGVTGTNGKTTTATLLYDLARLLGYKAGLLSTVVNRIDEKVVVATHTTPDALAINQYMKDMVDAGCEYCFMEVSSHAIHQHRIAGLDFDGALFSNITHDHLNYHITFKAYIEAKKMFFDNLSKNAFALTNLDDKNGEVMLQNCNARKYTYSCRTLADYNCKVIEKRLDGMLLSLNGTELWVKFTGDFNAYNLLAVYSTACLLGMNDAKILQAMSLLTPVAGRFETIISDTGIMAIVDYAHTPDALENVLSTIRPLVNNGNKLTVVVGAGGDRDTTKRPEMAEVACRLSDKVILTSDNPRTEEPKQIIADMEAGVADKYKCIVSSIVDRKEAIVKALSDSDRGDIVLIAGKGHEDYQEINGVKHHFDDREVVREYFNK